MTPQELERLGIAITGSANWIRPLATMMGFRHHRNVYKWWSGQTKITGPKQRKLYLLAGQPETARGPIYDDTRKRLARIKAMREQGYTYASIGQELGITRQAVLSLATRYRLVKPMPKLGTLTCPICSVTFQPKRQRQKCCSKRCGQRRWLLNRPGAPPRHPKACGDCGAMFQPRTHNGRFCSLECKGRHHMRVRQRRQMEQRRHERRDGIIRRLCGWIRIAL